MFQQIRPKSGMCKARTALSILERQLASLGFYFVTPLELNYLVCGMPVCISFSSFYHGLYPPRNTWTLMYLAISGTKVHQCHDRHHPLMHLATFIMSIHESQLAQCSKSIWNLCEVADMLIFIRWYSIYVAPAPSLFTLPRLCHMLLVLWVVHLYGIYGRWLLCIMASLRNVRNAAEVGRQTGMKHNLYNNT